MDDKDDNIIPEPNEPLDLVIELPFLDKSDNKEEFAPNIYVTEYRNGRWFHGIIFFNFNLNSKFY